MGETTKPRRPKPTVTPEIGRFRGAPVTTNIEGVSVGYEDSPPFLTTNTGETKHEISEQNWGETVPHILYEYFSVPAGFQRSSLT